MTALEAELIAEVERLQKELESMQDTKIDLILSKEALLRELEKETQKTQKLETELKRLLETLKESFKAEQERTEQHLQSLESDYQKQLQTLQTELEKLSQ